MNFDEFTGQLQHRLGAPGTDQTARTAGATLSTLGARIPEAESDENWGKLFAVVDGGGWVDPSASAP